MEFNNLPHEIKLIAAKCLADKINSVSGFGENAIPPTTAKEQARQVRDAFIELFSDRELNDEKKEAAEKVAATLIGLQHMVGEDETIKCQIGHLISATDDLLEKCL